MICDTCGFKEQCKSHEPSSACMIVALQAAAYQKKTNADRIREMTDEELATLIDEAYLHYCNSRITGCGKNRCYDCCLNWLKEEVKE